MKNPYRYFLLIVAVLGLSFASLPLFAQASAPASATPTVTAPAVAGTGISALSIVGWLTPILVPLVIAGVKKVAPSIPSFLLPIIAPMLGMLIDYINTLVTHNAGNLVLAAALGLAGVGIREVKDQLVPASPAPSTS